MQKKATPRKEYKGTPRREKGGNVAKQNRTHHSTTHVFHADLPVGTKEGDAVGTLLGIAVGTNVGAAVVGVAVGDTER